jgi:hypothetical protein
VAVPTRIVTFADEDEPERREARRMSISARMRVELSDGRRIPVLGERGWSAGLHGGSGSAGQDIWSLTTAEDITEMARIVVGPDEPIDGETYEQADAWYWAAVADELRPHGVITSRDELSRLPHEVVLSDRLLGRLGRPLDA